MYVDYFVVLVTFTCLKPFTSANAKEAKLSSRHNFSYVYCVPRFCLKIYIRLTCSALLNLKLSTKCWNYFWCSIIASTCLWSDSFLMRLIQLWMSNCVYYNLAYIRCIQAFLDFCSFNFRGFDFRDFQFYCGL